MGSLGESVPASSISLNSELVNPGRGLCGLALIFNNLQQSCGGNPVDYFPRLAMQKKGNVSLIETYLPTESGTATWGKIAELTPFKLQWNCRDRNIDYIDYARRWGLLKSILGLALALYRRLGVSF